MSNKLYKILDSVNITKKVKLLLNDYIKDLVSNLTKDLEELKAPSPNDCPVELKIQVRPNETVNYNVNYNFKNKLKEFFNYKNAPYGQFDFYVKLVIYEYESKAITTIQKFTFSYFNSSSSKAYTNSIIQEYDKGWDRSYHGKIFINFEYKTNNDTLTPVVTFFNAYDDSNTSIPTT